MGIKEGIERHQEDRIRWRGRGKERNYEVEENIYKKEKIGRNAENKEKKT